MRKPTTLIKSDTLSNYFGCDVWLKMELWNPTGSHKDRESLKIMEECKGHGISEIGCASTGNFGISLAYYTKMSGLRCHVWLPSGRAYPTVIDLLRAFSAEIHLLDCDLGELYPSSSEEMRNLYIYDVNPGKCPAKIVGNVEIGQEIIAQIRNIDTVVCCLNNGTHHLSILLDVIQPDLIVSLGQCALQALHTIEPHQIELRQDVSKPVKWRGYTILPMYHPSPRATIRRSTAEQTRDFSFLGELLGRREFDRELPLLIKSL